MHVASTLYSPLSHLKWRLHKIARQNRRIFCRKFYKDKNTDPRRSIIVAGTGRSGTTWLADLIASQMSSRIMFEPFNSELVNDFAQFNYFQYMRPDQMNEALLDIVRRVLTGQIRDPWIDRQVETLRPDWRIVKEIRACLFLKWIHDYFPEVPMVFIVRHPCAVVASRIKLNWATDSDIEPFLAQKPLIEDFLGEHISTIHNAKTKEEKHAVVWCVSNLVPLRQFRNIPPHMVFYENLCLHPEEEIKNIFHAIGRPYTASAFRYAKRPSTTTHKTSAILGNANPTSSWQRELSDVQITRVLRIVEDFGLGHLYGDSDLPASKFPNQG